MAVYLKVISVRVHTESSVLNKLDDGVTLLDWITDFLVGRTHCTRVGNEYSTFLPFVVVLFKEALWGLLLFFVFINDITDIFNDSVMCKLYADDVTLYIAAKSVADNFSF